MDKDQTAREAEMAFSETLRKKASAGRPRLEDLMGDSGAQEPKPRPDETREGEDES